MDLADVTTVMDDLIRQAEKVKTAKERRERRQLIRQMCWTLSLLALQ